ncbi:MAG: hypothetical protein H7328_09955 [Bdellovibrio sp.]|nr:hypothetical protein [Bdellovibrio sp.]
MFSCSKLETGLQLAPRIVSNRIDDAFDYKSGKLSALRKQIDTDIQSYKKGLALRLISHIDVILELSKKDKITSAEIKTFIDSAKETQEDIILHFQSSFESALSDLSEKQISHFKKYSDKKIDSDLEDSDDKKDFLNDRKKSILKTYGYFFDDLTDLQKKLVEEFVNQHYAYFVERIKIRKQFSDHFHLKLVANEPATQFAMNYYAGNTKQFSSGLIKFYMDDFYKFQADFWNMTPEKERINLRKNINSYKDQLKKIAGI